MARTLLRVAKKQPLVPVYCAGFCCSDSMCLTSASITDFTDSSDEPSLDVLNALPHTGISGPPCPGTTLASIDGLADLLGRKHTAVLCRQHRQIGRPPFHLVCERQTAQYFKA